MRKMAAVVTAILMMTALCACADRTAAQAVASEPVASVSWPDPSEVLDSSSKVEYEAASGAETSSLSYDEEVEVSSMEQTRIVASSQAPDEEEEEEPGEKTSIEFDAPEGFLKAMDGSGMIYAPDRQKDGSYINLEILEPWPELTSGEVAYTQASFEKSVAEMYKIFFNDRSATASIQEYTVYTHQDYQALRCSYIATGGGRVANGTQVFIDANPLYCITLVDYSGEGRWSEEFAKTVESIEIKVIKDTEMVAQHRPEV